MLPWETIDEIMAEVKIEVVKDNVEKAKNSSDTGTEDSSSGGGDSWS